MRTHLLSLVIAAALVVASGCMSFELEGDGLKTPQSKHGSEIVHGSLYGFMWASREIEKCSDNLGLYRVEYHTNLFYILASTCSLGFYVPQTVEWWCQAPKQDDDGPILKPSK